MMHDTLYAVANTGTGATVASAVVDLTGGGSPSYITVAIAAITVISQYIGYRKMKLFYAKNNQQPTDGTEPK